MVHYCSDVPWETGLLATGEKVKKKKRKKSINSRRKGAEGELEFRDVLRSFGIQAIRGQQFAGGGDSPDVKHNIPGFHFEVKRVQSGNPYNWLQQATDDCNGGSSKSKRKNADVSQPRNLPVVAHRRNGKDWIAILDMSAFLTLLKEAGKLPDPDGDLLT